MTTFILVRHGQSQANLDYCFAGQSDSPLTQQGVLQAEKLSAWVTSHYHIHKIYASDLCRAYQTAIPVAQTLGLDIIKNPNFREIYAGLWQGQPFEHINSLYMDDYGLWLGDIGQARCTQGESVRELSQRVFQEMCHLAEENVGQTLLIATHATPIRAFQTLCQKGDILCAKDVPWVANASVSVCVYDSGKFEFTLIGYNDYLDDLKSTFPAGVV